LPAFLACPTFGLTSNEIMRVRKYERVWEIKRGLAQPSYPPQPSQAKILSVPFSQKSSLFSPQHYYIRKTESQMKIVIKQQVSTTRGTLFLGNPASGNDYLLVQISAKEEREILRQFETHVAEVLAGRSQSVSNPARAGTGE